MSRNGGGGTGNPPIKIGPTLAASCGTNEYPAGFLVCVPGLSSPGVMLSGCPRAEETGAQLQGTAVLTTRFIELLTGPYKVSILTVTPSYQKKRNVMRMAYL